MEEGYHIGYTIEVHYLLKMSNRKGATMSTLSLVMDKIPLSPTSELFIEIFQTVDDKTFEYLREQPCAPGNGNYSNITLTGLDTSCGYRFAFSLSVEPKNTNLFSHVFGARCPRQFLCATPNAAGTVYTLVDHFVAASTIKAIPSPVDSFDAITVPCLPVGTC